MPRMLLDELGQQLLLPGGDRGARRLGLMSAPPASAGGSGIETEKGAIVGPLEGVDFRLEPAEADLGLQTSAPPARWRR